MDCLPFWNVRDFESYKLKELLRPVKIEPILVGADELNVNSAHIHNKGLTGQAW